MFKRLMQLIAGTTLSAGLTTIATDASADAMVWKVSNKDGELYLGGTIHMLRATDYPLKPEYDIAFKDSDVVVFETDIEAAMDMGFQQKMMMRMSLAPGKTLKDVLQPATYQRLENFATSRNLPMMMLQSFKPSLAVLTLTQLELQRFGITSTSGLETYYSGLARQHNKPVLSLETPDEQIDVLASMGDGYEDEFVNGSLDDLNNLEKDFGELIKAWKDADIATIDEKMTQMMKERFPQMYDALLVKRNFNWLNDISKMIKTPEKEFVLVGAAHLVGTDSVQALLKAQGYTIEQVKVPSGRSKANSSK